MKKIVSIILAGLMVFSLVGCSSGSTTTASKEVSTIEKIKENKKIVIGTAPGYMPFEMKDTDDNFIGYDIDLGNAIGEALGVEVEWKQYEFSGLIPALQTGDIDLLLGGMTIRGDRALAVSFSEPYYATGQVLMVPASDTTTKSWEDLDVEGNVIAASQGTTGALLAKQLFKNAEVVDYADYPTASMAVGQENADGIIYDEPAVKQYSIIHEGEVRGIFDLISAENLGAAVKLNDVEMVMWLNSFLYSYRNSPDDLASIDKWFNSTDWIETVAD
jgi:polar amino acid transport system substrate-binding protein